MRKTRKVFKRILILCEGFTELQYAKALKQSLPRDKQRNYDIEIDNYKKKDPKNLALEAEKRKKKAVKENNSYDEIWLFFDNDNNANLCEAFEIIQKHGFKFAYSSICVEFWFLLHFEDSGRTFQTPDQLITHLKKKWPTYHKTKINHYAFLSKDLDNAVKRAKMLIKNMDEGKLCLQNPYTNVFELIEFMKLDV